MKFSRAIINGGAIKLSSMLKVDVAAEECVGEHVDIANTFLKRTYREPFGVPELVS